jgi:hypothetical protein
MTALDDLRALAKQPTETWLDDLEYHANGLADAMTAIHGGIFNIVINHRAGQVLIAQQHEGTPVRKIFRK